MRTPERFRAELEQALFAHAGSPVSQQVRHLPTRPRRRTVTRLVPSAAAALIAVAVAAVILTSQGTSPPPASAATVLYASAAALQRSGTSLQLSSHSYLYERTVGESRFVDPSGHKLVHEIYESWTARNGAGRQDDTVLNPSIFLRMDERGLGSSDSRVRPSSHPFLLIDGISLSYDQLQRLPSSPKGLAAVVGQLADREARAFKESSPSAHSTIVLYILHSIAQTPAPTAVRAAVYRVMASTPGIRLLGQRRDAIGRLGEMFTATLGPERAELIIDPSTGRLLEYTRIQLRRQLGWAPGLISRVTYVNLTVVRSTSDHPH
jgi:hypothetical protein